MQLNNLGVTELSAEEMQEIDGGNALAIGILVALILLALA